MNSTSKDFIRNIMTTLSDKMQKAHDRQVAAQQADNETNRMQAKKAYSMQLQSELYHIFGSMSAPTSLQQICYPSDLRISTRPSDPDNVYRFRWAKQGSGNISPTHLRGIKDKLNSALMEYRCRLDYSLMHEYPYPDNLFIAQAHPFTIQGFRVVNCTDTPFDIELAILIFRDMQ